MRITESLSIENGRGGYLEACSDYDAYGLKKRGLTRSQCIVPTCAGPCVVARVCIIHTRLRVPCWGQDTFIGARETTSTPRVWQVVLTPHLNKIRISRQLQIKPSRKMSTMITSCKNVVFIDIIIVLCRTAKIFYNGVMLYILLGFRSWFLSMISVRSSIRPVT